MRAIRRSLILIPVFAALYAPIGCSSNDEKKPAQSANDLAGRLQADTGVPWTTSTNPDNGEVRFMAPDEPVKVGTGSPEAMARAFFDRYQSDLHGSGNADELRLAELIEEPEFGTYVRFDHYVPGTELRIFDVVSTVTFTEKGELLYAHPGFRAAFRQVATTPSIDEAHAIQSAEREMLNQCEGAPRNPGRLTATLGVHAEEAGTPTLAWKIHGKGEIGNCSSPVVVVGAGEGSTLLFEDGAQDLIDTAAGYFFYKSGLTDVKPIQVTQYDSDPQSPPTFGLDARELGKGMPTVVTYQPCPTTTVPMSSEDCVIETSRRGHWDRNTDFAPLMAEGAAVDAHYHMVRALEFYQFTFKRNGPRHNSDSVSVLAHDNSNRNSQGRNASFNSDENLMRCGDGRGDLYPLCSAYDVVVHELTHGVTGATSKLVYRNEAGALNESFSDVMAASAENLMETQNPDRNFVMGELITKNGKPLRDYRNPVTGGFEPQPAHMNDIIKCNPGEEPKRGRRPIGNDNCGVHSNSGISNVAFALMTAGGTHPRSNITVQNPIGWEKARSLWYRTFTRLTSQSGFHDAALHMKADARALKFTSEEQKTVYCAWFASGVLNESEGKGITCGDLLRDAGADTGGGSTIDAGTTTEGDSGPPRNTGACAGRNDGYVCSKEQHASAFKCKNGLVESGIWCDDSEKSCTHAGPNDLTATVTGGKLQCN